MLPLLVLLVSLLAASSQAGTLPERVFYAPEDAEYHFEAFIATFNKQYSNEKEKTFRFNVFKENLKNINEKNAMGHAVFGVTQFTDLTKEEFLQKHTGFKRYSFGDDCKIAPVPEMGSVPDSLDWRDKGKVTKVKQQGGCGSCWTFSTTGNLEGAYAIKHNELIPISEQQLLDCDDTDYGCKGGEMGSAISWLLEHGGAMSESDYPYTERDGKCKFDKNKTVVQVTACNAYEVNEDQLKQVLAKVGPLAIAIDAHDYVDYKGGILECGPYNNLLDHAVLLVGYGKEGDKPYWIVKNSWGKTWGEQGYVRMLMGKNSCSMLTDIVSAVVA